MLLIAAMINYFFDNTSINKIRVFVLGIVFLFSVEKSLEYWFSASTMLSEPLKYCWSIMCFSIGGWLSREDYFQMKRKLLPTFLSGVVIVIIANVAVFYGTKNFDFGYYFTYNRIGCIALAVLLFMCFSLKNSKSSLGMSEKIVDFISKTSLDVYLGALSLEYLFYNMTVSGKEFYIQNIKILVFNFIFLVIVGYIRKCIWDKWINDNNKLLVTNLIIIGVTALTINII